MTRDIAIIGGGPTGFAVARALAEESADFRIRIYESQAQAGGVWVYTGKGPMYHDLDTNIFKELMEYRDRPFPEELSRYPDRRDVLDYVVKYSKEIENNPSVKVFWNTTVTGLFKKDGKWNLELKGVQASTDTADDVVIANGHYEHPFFPPIPGLAEYRKANPSKVVHTRNYTKPDPYRGLKVLMVGNGSSGTDIAIQLLSVTAPITVSRRSKTNADNVFEEGTDVVWKPVATNISSDGEVSFDDGTSDKFDVIIFATGYLYKLPFLESENSGKEGHELVDPNSFRVQNLYKFIFYIHDPSVAFVGLNKQVVPMPLAESQGAVIARVWSGRLKLPTQEEMHEDEQKVIDEKGSGGGYFLMGYPKDVEYMHALNDWADSAGPGGFYAERWGPEKVEMRSVIAEKKLLEYANKKRKAVEDRKRNKN